MHTSYVTQILRHKTSQHSPQIEFHELAASLIWHNTVLGRNLLTYLHLNLSTYVWVISSWASCAGQHGNSSMFDLHHTAAVELLGISILSGKACKTYESRPISIMTNCCYSNQWQCCCGESLYIIVHCERCDFVKLHVLMPSSSLIYDFQKIYIKCSQNDMCKYIYTYKWYKQ